jgi:hypothetical protein
VLATTRETESFARLSPTAAAVWRHLEEARTAADLVDRLSREYEEEAERIGPQVERLLRDLVDLGLIEVVADGDD